MHFQWGNTAPQRGARDSWGGGQQKNLALLTYKAKIYIQHINSYTISVVLRKKSIQRLLRRGKIMKKRLRDAVSNQIDCLLC